MRGFGRVLMVAGVVATVAPAALSAGLAGDRIAGPTVTVNGSFAIPDDSEFVGVTIELPITGTLHSIADVTISITLDHTWIGDLEVTLEAPDNAARLKLVGRAGLRSSGSVGQSSNLDGAYTFDDFAAGDLWATIAVLGNDDDLPAGTYRTTTSSRLAAGGGVQSSSGGCSTYLSGAFGGLTPQQADGTWRLKLFDRAPGDLGTVMSVTLTLNYPELIERSGFETYGATGVPFTVRFLPELGSNQAPIRGSSVRGSCRPAQYDFDGDGWSDFAVIDEFDGDAQWFVELNDGVGTGAGLGFTHGDPSDIFVVDDFDGDGIDDAATWSSPGGDGRFFVRRSSRPSSPVIVHFGRTDDDVVADPTQSGDYDGDGVADLGLFQSNTFAAGDGPASWRVLPSTTGAFTVRTYDTGLVGKLGDFFPTAGFDSSGDGIADLHLQTTSVSDPSAGHWHLFDGVDGQLLSEFDFGNSSDFILPGNHIGNSQADVTVRRTVLSVREHDFRDGQTGAIVGPTSWGVAGDFSVPGDYDGDGLDDLAVWRPSAVGGQSRFIIRKSTNPAAVFEVSLGNDQSYPVGSSRVH